jgi:hypothetical protein
MTSKKAVGTLIIDPPALERRIFALRGQRVMLDSDLAELYGVPTKALNQAVARNSDRFPDDFAYQLSRQEFAALKSQIVTSKTGRGGKQKLPWVFTEHGVAMLSSVLRSSRAVQVNIAIMRVFVQLRRISSTPAELASQLMELAKTIQLHDEQIKQISEVLRRLMEPQPQSKPEMGFHTLRQPAIHPNGQPVSKRRGRR